MEGIEEFFFVHGVEGLALSVEGFEGFDDGFGHAVVGRLGTTDNGKLLRAGDAFVSVVIIETQTHEEGALL